MVNIFTGKNILVTGGTGSIGSEIVRKLLPCEPRGVRVFSNDENGMFNLERRLGADNSLHFLLGDIRDKACLKRAIEDIDLVFHAAALKHIPICEYNPFEAVKTNVLGTQNLIEAAIEEEIDKLITISTDKAVNPVNVMGATKLLAERITVAANYYKGMSQTVLSSVRFGNVLNSRGSVTPIFHEQIRRGGPLTITDPDMTRFVMSIPRAVELVLRAAELAAGGEIFILKMPALRLGDLAEVMIEELAPRYGRRPGDIRIQVVQKRPGEKVDEELMTAEEAQNAAEFDGMYVISSTLTAEKDSRVSNKPRKPYISSEEKLLTKPAIRQLVRELDDVSGE